MIIWWEFDLGAAWRAEQRELLLGVQGDDARGAETEELDSASLPKQRDGLLHRVPVQVVARPVETCDGVVEDLLDDRAEIVRVGEHRVRRRRPERETMGET